MRPLLLIGCLLAATGCDEPGITGPTVTLRERFVLKPGEAAVIAGAGVRVQFVGVTGDSRCPADVVCIQGGDAVVHVRVFAPGARSDHELHTGDTRLASALVYRNIRVRLLELQPYPFSSRAIDPSDYRATMVAEPSD